ncbi:hypothetical protein DFS34DRAFT_407099 [Phlyctochytrium arcticum]|nr:hypothetical protein DFS34DRAFT_407099 [Phlyctochytrium arcticum]
MVTRMYVKRQTGFIGQLYWNCQSQIAVAQLSIQLAPILTLQILLPVVASINKGGRQSFLLNDIKNILRAGGNVTHILKVKVSRQRNSQEGNAIRAEIYQRIANIPVTKQIGGMAVSITWRTSATTTSAYYHADVPFFTDIVVKGHSEKLLPDILTTLILVGTTGLAFLVSSP